MCIMDLIEKATLLSKMNKQICLVKIKTYRVRIIAISEPPSRRDFARRDFFVAWGRGKLYNKGKRTVKGEETS